jgi:hypothetical protein
MDIFFTYLTTFASKWWAIVSAFALFGIEPVVKAYWPWGYRQIERLSAQTRTRVEIGILIAAFFYAGYSSWSEEHASPIKTTDDLGTMRGERDEARRQGGASPAQQSTINRLSGDLTNARGQIDEQKETISKLQTELNATKNLYASRHLSEEQKQLIQENVKVPPNDNYSFSIFQPPDYEYSTEFVETLTAPSAGWTLTLFTTMHGGINPRFRGIALMVKDPANPPKGAIALVNALTAAHIGFVGGQEQGVLHLAEGDVGILIGPKEGQ